MDKIDKLKDILKGMKSVLIAFSGGVDSSFLLKVASDVLGEKVVALTAMSPTYPHREIEFAQTIANLYNVTHILINSNELLYDGFVSNTKDRCYICKKELFSICIKKSKELGLNFVCDGTNKDDLFDFRPGLIAGEELGVRHPLSEAGMSKDDIRRYSREMGIPGWDRQPFACLSSRFPYGVKITESRLRIVEIAEDILHTEGFNTVRVRYHNDIARIEVGKSELFRFLDRDLNERLVSALKRLGFVYICIDLEGYRQGSMNEV